MKTLGAVPKTGLSRLSATNCFQTAHYAITNNVGHTKKHHYCHHPWLKPLCTVSLNKDERSTGSGSAEIFSKSCGPVASRRKFWQESVTLQMSTWVLGEFFLRVGADHWSCPVFFEGPEGDSCGKEADGAPVTHGFGLFVLTKFSLLVKPVPTECSRLFPRHGFFSAGRRRDFACARHGATWWRRSLSRGSSRRPPPCFLRRDPKIMGFSVCSGTNSTNTGAASRTSLIDMKLLDAGKATRRLAAEEAKM